MRLGELHNGVLQYMPIVFTGENFALAEFVITSFLSELRVSPTPISEAYEDDTVLIISNTKQKPKEKISQENITVPEAIFGLMAQGTPEEINKGIQKNYINRISSLYNKMRSKYCTIKKTMESDHIEDYKFENIIEDDIIKINDKKTDIESSEAIIDSVNNRLNIYVSKLENLWYQYIQILITIPYKLVEYLKTAYTEKIQIELERFIQRLPYKIDEDKIPFITPDIKNRTAFVDKLRNTLEKTSIDILRTDFNDLMDCSNW